MEFFKKLPGTAIALLLYYVLPLSFRIDLLADWHVWPPMFICVLVYLVQPAANASQLTSREDKNSMLFLALGTTVSQIWIVAEWAYFSKNQQFEPDIFSALGAVMMLAGFFFRWWAIRVLAHYFSNAVRLLPRHKLIRTGPYTCVRHPSYTGAFLVALGIGLFLHAWTGIMVTVPVLLAAYSYRIEVEEQRLLAAFGNAYIKYQQRTCRLFWMIW